MSLLLSQKGLFFKLLRGYNLFYSGLDFRIGCSLRSHHGRFIIYPCNLKIFISSTANIFAVFTPYREMSGILIYRGDLKTFISSTANIDLSPLIYSSSTALYSFPKGFIFDIIERIRIFFRFGCDRREHHLRFFTRVIHLPSQHSSFFKKLNVFLFFLFYCKLILLIIHNLILQPSQYVATHVTLYCFCKMVYQ